MRAAVFLLSLLACGDVPTASPDAATADASVDVAAEGSPFDLDAAHPIVACSTVLGDVQTDPHNCGAVGHDCDGGACEAGACVPLPPGVLATGQQQPFAITVDAENVYWLNLGTLVKLPRNLGVEYGGGGQLLKCALAGCNNRPTVLADLTQPNVVARTPTGLALASGVLSWSDDGRILGCPTTGCSCKPTVVAPIGGDGIASNATNVFWTEPQDGTVAGCAASGCTYPTILTKSAVGPVGIALDATNVYWTTINGTLSSCALANCTTPATIWKGQGSEANTLSVFVDDTNLYWTNSNPLGYGSVLQCAKADCENTVVTLAAGRNAPIGIVATATTVYWTEGSIYACAIGGCNGAPTAIGSGTPAITADAQHLYWTDPGTGNDDGRIVVRALP